MPICKRPERPVAGRPLQFTLRQVAIAVLGLCVFLAIVVQWGGAGFLALMVGLVTIGLCYDTYWGHLVRGSVLAVLLVVLAAPLIVTIQRPPHRSRLCEHNLKQIGMALHNYHIVYGCFPPPYIADASGRPLHSWRVLLLPYINEQPLYDQYNFAEPCSGPNNRLLAAEIPSAYQCRDLPRGLTSEAAYLAVVGPGTAWRTDRPTSLQDIEGGLGDTLLVVEVHESGVNWLDPRDWTPAAVPLPANRLPQPKYTRFRLGWHTRQQYVLGLFADGSVKPLFSDLKPAEFQALSAISKP